MRNYTRTIFFETKAPRFETTLDHNSPEWSKAFDEYYKANVKPIYDNTKKCVNQIEADQASRIGEIKDHQPILWNKCRYFELSVYTSKELLLFVSRSAKVRITYKNMLVGGADKLEAVVRAFNKKGVYCIIEQNWI